MHLTATCLSFYSCSIKRIFVYFFCHVSFFKHYLLMYHTPVSTSINGLIKYSIDWSMIILVWDTSWIWNYFQFINVSNTAANYKNIPSLLFICYTCLCLLIINNVILLIKAATEFTLLIVIPSILFLCPLSCYPVHTHRPHLLILPMMCLKV